MPLMNDMARCMGDMHLPTTGRWICDRRETCARYVERHQGGPRTMTYAYLCSEGDDNYIQAEKCRDN